MNDSGKRVLTEKQFDQVVEELMKSEDVAEKSIKTTKVESTPSQWAGRRAYKKSRRDRTNYLQNKRQRERYCSDEKYREKTLLKQERRRRDAGSLPQGHSIEKAGHRFGKLVLLERPYMGTHGNIKTKLHVVRCKCDCGTEKTYALQSLRHGQTDCGCMDEKRYKKRAERRRNEILILKPGMKFNRWTVIEQGKMKKARGNGDRKQYALCRCECGTEKNVAAHHLISLATMSCGCHRSEVSSIIATERIRTGSTLRHRWLYINEHEEIEMRSMWELALADALDHYGYEWEYEPEVFKLTKSKRYIPDFYLPEEDRWIEVKGDNYLKMFLKTGKREMFEKLGYTLDLVMKKDIERITGMSDQRLRDYYADRHVKA